MLFVLFYKQQTIIKEIWKRMNKEIILHVASDSDINTVKFFSALVIFITLHIQLYLEILPFSILLNIFK